MQQVRGAETAEATAAQRATEAMQRAVAAEEARDAAIAEMEREGAANKVSAAALSPKPLLTHTLRLQVALESAHKTIDTLREQFAAMDVGSVVKERVALETEAANARAAAEDAEVSANPQQTKPF